MSVDQEAVVQLFADEFGLEGHGPEEPIFSAKVLDSMDVLRLIVLIEQNYNVKIPVFEVSLEMFDTIVSITHLIQKYQNK